MKTLVCTEPGRLAYDTEKEPAPASGQAIIRIRRIGICGTDLHAFEGTQPYFNYPRILGHELSGDVVAVDDAAGFETGEAVTFIPYFSCGHCIACRNGKPNCCSFLQVCGVHVDGGMREYLSVPASSLVHGEGLPYDELAMAEPLAIGAHGVRRAAVKEGEFVLIIGAGPIGLGAMEFACMVGGNVIAMDINGSRLQFCKDKINIHHTILASAPDALDKLREITGGDMPTVVMDCTGSQKAIQHAFSYMAHGGRYVLIGLQKGDISFSHPEFHKREATLMSSRNATRVDFQQVIDAMKKGLVSPLSYITHRVSFDRVKEEFESWLDPANGVIKAMVEIA